jgi:hypothetical protein
MDLHRLIALRPILLLLTTTVLIGSCASSAPLKQSDLEGLIEGMEKKAYIVNQFQAEFQKTRMVPGVRQRIQGKWQTYVSEAGQGPIGPFGRH